VIVADLHASMQTRQNKHTSEPVDYLLPDMYTARVEVVFGTPSKHCSGSGICMVTSAPLVRTTITCPHAPARLRKVPGEGLVFLFAKKHINTDALMAYFVSPYFLVEEPFALPRRLAKYWHLPLSWVPPGCYDLEAYRYEWRLYIPLFNLEAGSTKSYSPDLHNLDLYIPPGYQSLPAEALGPPGFKDRLSQ